MALEPCFGCANTRGPCFTDRPVVAFDGRAAARGALLGGVVALVLGGPTMIFWGSGLSAILNGFFADAVDRKLRSI